MEASRTLERLQTIPAVACDIETTGFHPWNGDIVRGISLAADGWSTYLPVTHPDSDNITSRQYEAILEALSKVGTLVFHNSAFDLGFLLNEGMPAPVGKVHDTLVFSWLQDENRRLSLKELTGERDEQDALKEKMKAHCLSCGSRKSRLTTKRESEELGVEWKTRQCAECGSLEWVPKRGWDELTYADMKDYAKKDAELTWQLYQVQRKFIDVPPELFAREMEVHAVVLKMRERGLHVDVNRAQLEFDRCDYTARQLQEELPFLPSSPKQVGEYLTGTEKLRLPRKNGTGNMQTDSDTLLHFTKNKTVQKILEYRGVAKEGQFYDKLLTLADPDGYVHPSWRPTGTVSGRFSCSDPNAQQWPRDGAVRDCIVPPEGQTYLSFDLSQAELRVAAYYSQSPFLLDAFNGGRDVYQEVAAKMGIDRQAAKTVVLGTQYGAGPRKLRTLLFRAGVDVSAKVARQWWEEWRALVPEIPKTRDIAERTAYQRGYVKLITPGRVRRFRGADIWRADPKDSFNALCQGGVAEAVKTWMLAVEESEIEIIAQIHDSLTVQVPVGTEEEVVAFVTKLWHDCNPFPVNIPVEAKRGL